MSDHAKLLDRARWLKHNTKPYRPGEKFADTWGDVVNNKTPLGPLLATALEQTVGKLTLANNDRDWWRDELMKRVAEERKGVSF